MNKLTKNKKGFSFQWEVLVKIVIAIVILVILIAIIMMSMQNGSEAIDVFGGI